MSVQHHQAAARSINSVHGRLLRSLTEALLRRLLCGIACGQLVVDTPAGDRLVFDGAMPGPQARFSIRSWRGLWRIAANRDIGFAEAYRAGEWSSPNLAALLKFVCRNPTMTESLRSLWGSRLWRRLRHALNRNTPRGSRRNIAAHYDLGNDFYEKWLDSGMTYSSGLFCSPDQTLEEAQEAKLARVIDMLGLSGGEEVLEIGCGWGALAGRMMEQHDCAVTAVTLSTEQLAYAQHRLQDHVRAGQCDLRLQDYRDVHGTFDRIVSIEMLEAVGESYWPTYFARLRDRLRPGGVAVLQFITIDDARFEHYRRRPDFVQKYIFPGGMLPTTQIIERQVAKAGLRMVASEFFGESYARTLEEWGIRFQKAWHMIEALGFDERFKRTWEYYLAYCQVGFEEGAVNVGLHKIARAMR
jgi:cyclopropane-fatty-acyl-phospholipid synthase